MNLTSRMRQQVIVVMGAALAAAFLLTLIFALWLRRDADTAPAAGTGPNSPILPASDSLSRMIEQSSPVIPVYLTKPRLVEKVPIEAYVRGVLAAEMPIDFEPEALKAQALAARTYIVRRLQGADAASPPPVKGALVTDTVSHQAYLSEADLARRWSGKAAAANLEKLNRAVADTKGLILTYGGKPIDAVFFSTSNGYTENAEDYWGKPEPYLKSVPSPWDVQLSPKYKSTTTLPYKTFLQKLGLPAAVAASAAAGSVKSAKETAGHRIASIRIGGKLFTGREVREKLELPSAHFEWRLRGSSVEITTYGYGHGVGMSQYGANGMAKEGRTAEEIVRYYYKDIDISVYQPE